MMDMPKPSPGALGTGTTLIAGGAISADGNEDGVSFAVLVEPVEVLLFAALAILLNLCSC